MPIIAVDNVNPRPRTRQAAQPETVASGEVSVAPVGPKRAYEVGFGKPPKHSQWKKGQSGNPKGRRKGARGLKTIIKEVSSERIAMRTGRGEKRVPKIEAMIHKLMEKAFSGDIRAMGRVLELYAQAVPDFPERDEARAEPADLTETDRKTIADFKAMVAAELGAQRTENTTEADDV